MAGGKRWAAASWGQALTPPPVSPRAIMDKKLAAYVNILPKSSAL